jgi:hypothetical protein
MGFREDLPARLSLIEATRRNARMVLRESFGGTSEKGGIYGRKTKR